MGRVEVAAMVVNTTTEAEMVMAVVAMAAVVAVLVCEV